jgi:predicted esterase
MRLARVFLHGLEGSSHGTKGTFFRKRFPEMIIGDFHGTLEKRMEKLTHLISHYTSLIIIGSSFGGLMAAIFACEHPHLVKRLILLAPALTSSEFRPYLDCRIERPVFVYHGRRDLVVPLGPLHHLAERVFLDLVFNVVDDDHLLSQTFEHMEWDDLLEMGQVCLSVEKTS